MCVGVTMHFWGVNCKPVNPSLFFACLYALRGISHRVAGEETMS